MMEREIYWEDMKKYSDFPCLNCEHNVADHDVRMGKRIWCGVVGCVCKNEYQPDNLRYLEDLCEL